jgi:hypothetical protein
MLNTKEEEWEVADLCQEQPASNWNMQVQLKTSFKVFKHLKDKVLLLPILTYFLENVSLNPVVAEIF